MQRRKELGEFISYHRHRQQLFGHGQVRNQVEFGRERHKNSKFPPIGKNSKFPPIGNRKFFPITNRGKLTIVRRFVEKKKKQTFLTKLVRTIRKRIGVLSRGCLVSNVSLEKILLNKEMLKLIGRSNVGIRFKRIKKRLTKRLNKVKLKQRELKCIFNLLRDEGVSRQESLRLLKPLIRINGFKRRKLSCLIRKFKRNCKRRRRTLGRIVKEQAKELLFFWGKREKAFSLDKLTQGYWKNRKRLRWKFPFANRLFFKKAISVISNSFISFSSTKGVQEREFDKFCNEASMYFHEERKHLYWFRNSSWKGYAFAKVRKKEQRVKRFWSEKKPSGSTNLFRGLFQKALRLRLYKDKKLGIQQMVNYARINRFKAIGVEKGRTMAMLKTGVVRRKRRFGLSPRALQLLRRRILRGRAINNRNKRKKNALFRRLRKALFLRVVHLLQSLTQGQKRNKETLLVAASLVKLAARLSPRLSVKYKCKNYTVPRYKAKPYISKVPNSSAKYNYLLMQDNLPRKGLYSSSGISAEQGKWLKPETIKGSNISYIKFLPVKANLWQGKVKSLRNNYAVSFVQGLQRLKFLFLAYNDFAMMAALRRKKKVQFSERTRFYWITLLLRNIVKVAKVRRRVKSILVGYVARFLQRHFSGYLLRIRIIYIRNNFVNATLLANYLVAKFRMKYNLGTLMSIIFNTFFYKMGFRGVLVVASGRFTRAERATFKRRRRGRLSTSTLDFPVEYYLSQVALKYGACGLKVVVCRFKKFNHSFWRFGDEKI